MYWKVVLLPDCQLTVVVPDASNPPGGNAPRPPVMLEWLQLLIVGGLLELSTFPLNVAQATFTGFPPRGPFGGCEPAGPRTPAQVRAPARPGVTLTAENPIELARTT